MVTKLKEARTLVVAVSPLAAGDVSEALGADAFLQKPIDARNFAKQVAAPKP